MADRRGSLELLGTVVLVAYPRGAYTGDGVRWDLCGGSLECGGCKVEKLLRSVPGFQRLVDDEITGSLKRGTCVLLVPASLHHHEQVSPTPPASARPFNRFPTGMPPYEWQRWSHHEPGVRRARTGREGRSIISTKRIRQVDGLANIGSETSKSSPCLRTCSLWAFLESTFLAVIHPQTHIYQVLFPNFNKCGCPSRTLSDTHYALSTRHQAHLHL